MSRILVDQVRSNSASSDALTLDGSGNITVPGNITLSGNATLNGTATGFPKPKAHNIVINGAMNIAQRGLTASGSGANGFSTVDRFAMYQAGTDDYPETAQADIAAGTTPYTEGFRKSFKITNGNQGSGGQAGDQLYISHKIEAQDMATSGWNYTSSSSYITLSFWVKSSVAQNFYAYLKTADGTSQIYPFETGTLTADTWTKITKTMPGAANIQFDTDTESNRVSMGVEFAIGLFFGTDYTGSLTLNQWGTWSSSNRAPDYGTSNDDWYETNNATFELTGVQLEVGDSASDFDHKSYAQDLQLCKRYYEQFTPKLLLIGRYSNNYGYPYTQYFYMVEKRAAPTGSHSGTFISSTGYAGNPNFSDLAKDSVALYASNQVDAGGNLYVHDGGSALIKYDAEM